MMLGESNASRWHIVITLACSLHIIQALMLYLDPTVIGVTSLSTVGRLVGAQTTIGILLVTAGLAIWSQFRPISMTKALVIIPQQLLLFVSAAGVLKHMALGEFADGAERAHEFIAADQMMVVLISIGHAWGLVGLWREAISNVE